MLYLLDTAHLAAIERTIDLYPVSGVTTNPTIISRERQPFQEHLLAIRRLIGPDRQLHVQVVGSTAEVMLAEAQHLAELVDGDFYAKVPVTPQGLKAIRLIAASGIQVTATAIFTPQQAMLAARAGATYVAPYVNRLDDLQGDGPGVVAEIVAAFRLHGVTAMVLAASFKNAQQVQRCCAVGAPVVTVAPEMLDLLLAHPLTDKGVARFAQDWETTYGPGKVTSDV